MPRAMKEAVSSFDLIAIVSELQELVGGHIDKVYQEGDDFYLRVNIAGGGRREIYIRPGKWLCIREEKEKPETPPPFASALRRYLSNASITAITQRGFDRVVIFDLQTERSYKLIIELFGGGNLILVEDEKTVLCQRTQVLRNRQIKVGQAYEFPPSGINPLDIDRDDFHMKLKEGKGNVVRTLATDFNVGGLYAEEICFVAGVDKKSKASSLPEDKLDALFTALNNLIVAVQDDRRPVIIMENGKAVDAVPIELQTYVNSEKEQHPTLSVAISKFLDSTPVPKPTVEVSPKVEVEARFKRRITQQEESIKALKQEEIRYEILAQLLYSHFQEFDDLLKTIREERNVEGGRLISIDHEKHTVTVAIGEEDKIELDYRKDVNGNAQILYKKRRDAQERATKVEIALAETREEMEKELRRVTKIARVTRAKPTKKFWFETFRWFISSEGYLVIAGRDIKSNESLVKRQMKAGDRYAHADTHGAPSVVVKEGAKAGELTLREACEFALTYSKAWSSKLASGSAYWVTPEQVSKTAESGEYVPKGAFVIRGKRNYLKDLQVKAAIGEIEYQGHKKVMAGPVSAVIASSKRYALLDPGEIPKETLTNRFARAFNVPSEEVSRILPPGPLKIAQTVGLELKSDS